MDEPPSKRQRRTDSAARWERNERSEKRDAPSRPVRDGLQRQDGDRDRDGRRDYVRSRNDRPPEEPRRRSRSVTRGNRRRERSRSRDKRDDEKDRARHRDNGQDRQRQRSWSRDRKRRRTCSRSPRRNDDMQGKGPPPTVARVHTPPPKTSTRPLDRTDVDLVSSTPQLKVPQSKKQDGDDETGPILNQMQHTMGFSDFKSTKNTKVPGNNVSAVRRDNKTVYRQYMNRVGGFNRPLSPTRQ